MKAKKIIIFCILGMIFASCEKKQGPGNDEQLTVEQETKTPVYKFVNTKDGIKIRESPGGTKIGSLKADERVEFLESCNKKEEIDGLSADCKKQALENCINKCQDWLRQNTGQTHFKYF